MCHVSMPQMDNDKAYNEKARQEPYKNAKSYIEQILEAKAVRPLTFYL